MHADTAVGVTGILHSMQTKVICNTKQWSPSVPQKQECLRRCAWRGCSAVQKGKGLSVRMETEVIATQVLTIPKNKNGRLEHSSFGLFHLAHIDLISPRPCPKISMQISLNETDEKVAAPTIYVSNAVFCIVVDSQLRHFLFVSGILWPGKQGLSKSAI